MPDDALTIYTTQWCGYCQRLKAQLSRASIPYREVDVEVDPASAALVEKINGGFRTVPTVVYPDGSSATNPSIREVADRLAQGLPDKKEPSWP